MVAAVVGFVTGGTISVGSPVDALSTILLLRRSEIDVKLSTLIPLSKCDAATILLVVQQAMMKRRMRAHDMMRFVCEDVSGIKMSELWNYVYAHCCVCSRAVEGSGLLHDRFSSKELKTENIQSDRTTRLFL